MKIKDCPERITCPAINSIIEELKTVSIEMKELNRLLESEQVEVWRQSLENIYTSDIESLRNANYNLREWGSDLHDQCIELESMNDILLNQVSDLENEVESLKSNLYSKDL